MTKITHFLNKKDYFLFFISVIFIIAQVWLDLKSPEYMSTITTILQTSNNISEILKNGGLMLACTFGSFIFSIIVGMFVAKIACAMSMRMRSKIYDNVNSFSKKEIHLFSTSSLVTRSTNDVTQIQMIVAMGLQILIKAPILAVWAVLKILGKSWQWTLTTAITVGILLVVIAIIIILCLPKFKIVQKQIDNINRVTREGLTGMRIIHAFNAEKYQTQKFEKTNCDLTKTQTFTYKALAFLSPFMILLMSGLSLAIYWVGAGVISSAPSADRIALFSDMVVFMTYAMLIISSFIMLIIIFMQLPRAMVSYKRIKEVIDTETSIKDGCGAYTNQVGTIEFKNVCFKYPDGKDLVLNNINLQISKGETVAFIGATGCGKTTLVDLIPRFYDATSGEVLVDGVNVKDYKLVDLHNKVGYVSQKAILLSGTVYDNVTLGKNIEMADVKKALQDAQAQEFVETMDNKEMSVIKQGGKNISGGQKQRLSIARAIAKKPEFIIFDDSFSALDYKTDQSLRATLESELNETTCLIIAQRIGTIKNADKIVVLQDGEVVGVGKHEELLQNCPIYNEIALSQLEEEEL